MSDWAVATVLRQPLVLAGGYPDGVWTCAWCAAELKGSAQGKAEIIHRADCRWIAEIREHAPG